MSKLGISLQITLLGCGSSTGVPTIGCQCPVCQDNRPYNKRLRSSLLLTRKDTGESLVIDTTPDFRQQLLSAKITRLENVLYTHTHADHCHGFDDLRAFYFINKKRINCWLSAPHLTELKSRFSYAFGPTPYKGTPPQLDLQLITEEPFSVLGIPVEPAFLPHGNEYTVCFKFGDFLYATDFNNFPPELINRWQNKVSFMIASGLRFKTHDSHSSIQETIELFSHLHVPKGIITHMNHEVDYYKDSEKLPSHLQFGHDGMIVDVLI